MNIDDGEGPVVSLLGSKSARSCRRPLPALRPFLPLTPSLPKSSCRPSRPAKRTESNHFPHGTLHASASCSTRLTHGAAHCYAAQLSLPACPLVGLSAQERDAVNTGHGAPTMEGRRAVRGADTNHGCGTAQSVASRTRVFAMHRPKPP